MMPRHGIGAVDRRQFYSTPPDWQRWLVPQEAAWMCQLGPGLLPTGTMAVGVVPFISQIEAWPLAFCHRMSASPSPLKSPTPAMRQLGPGFAPTSGWLNGVVLFISQIAAWPSVLCHKMSESPSPLKSPV